jgi:branched-subunit amino acid ABC-type transport system permease component
MAGQVILNGIIAGCEYGLIAAGLMLVYQVRSFFNLAHGAVYLTSAYVANFLIVVGNCPAAAAIPIAIAWGAGLGALMELAIYRPLIRRNATPTVLLIASLGILIAAQNIVVLAFGSFTRTFFPSGIPEGIVVAGLRLTVIQSLTICVYAVIVATLWLWFFRTKSGREARAVADNPQLSIAFGVNADAVILRTFAVASMLAAVAGILAGYNTSVFPSMGFWGILPGVVAIVVGGLGSISGAFVGGLFVGITQQLAGWFFPAQWQTAALFVLLFGFLLFRPQGFVGTVTRKG